MKGLRIRLTSTLGTVLKPFKPLLGLCTASLDIALSIFTSFKATVLAKPTAEPTPDLMIFALCTFLQ